MRKTNLLRRIGGLILSVLLLPGLAIFSGSVAQAQGRHRVIVIRPVRPYYGFGWYRRPFGYPYGYYGGYYSQYVFRDSESAFNQGYHDGLKTGSDDGRKDKSYDPERSHYFHDSGFGNFADNYRDGFSRGYSDGFRNNG